MDAYEISSLQAWERSELEDRLQQRRTSEGCALLVQECDREYSKARFERERGQSLDGCVAFLLWAYTGFEFGATIFLLAGAVLICILFLRHRSRTLRVANSFARREYAAKIVRDRCSTLISDCGQIQWDAANS